MRDCHILFHKPYNVLCQFTDGIPRSTLKDYIDIPEVYAVGRLDQDSEGLLLLTNNGRVQHRLSDPKFEHPKTYWVQVEGIPDEAALQKLRQGLRIKDYQTRPAEVRSLIQEPDLPPRDPPIRFRKTVPTAWLEMTLTEGKNRQVRRMTAAAGFPTLRLVRVAIAHLHLGGLAPGEWRMITPEEMQPLL
jgi:23S rRNA pseudouridine2457 synthase